MVSGTPCASPLAEPKLARMSLRTIPLWVKALGPLEPSPGNGPAVSSGIGVEVSVAAAVVAVVPAAPAVAVAGVLVALDAVVAVPPLVAAVVELEESLVDEQPTRAT